MLTLKEFRYRTDRSSGGEIKLDVLLIFPPNSSQYEGECVPPIGLASIASFVRKKHVVKIVDMNINKNSSENMLYYLQTFSPDIVGISSITCSFFNALKVLQHVKNYDSEIITVIGGPHVTFLPLEALSYSSIDFVIHHEAEESFSELVDTIEIGENPARVRGISFRNKGRVHSTPDRDFVNLDNTPIPSFDLLDMKNYMIDREKYYLMSSRGCPHSCIFCSSSFMWKHVWRSMSPQRLLKEILYLRDHYSPSQIAFGDDTFTLDKQRLLEVCSLLEECGIEKWACQSRVDALDEETVTAMYESGCNLIFFGAESGAQRMLNLIDKRISLDQTRETVRICRKVGIKVYASFIIGLPFETEEMVKKTLEFAQELDADITELSFLTPFPGTAVYKERDKYGIRIVKGWEEFTGMRPVAETSELTCEKQMELFLDAIAMGVITKIQETCQRSCDY
jgi:anaerobic magnesium-protoporphyrin IX monomethyl ester cyclase